MTLTTTARAYERQIDTTSWLAPIPGLRRTDPEHRYWLGDHLFAVSITGVVGSAKSDWALARIEATRHIWEPRGHTVHLALEALLHSRFHPMPQQRQQASELLLHLRAGDYRDWIEPLLAHPNWRQVTVIASERPTCCLIRNLAGTYDTGYIHHASGLRVLADLKTLSAPNSSSYCTRAQLGGYMALEATWGVHYDAGQTIWARPGETRFSPLYSREECLAAWAGYVSRMRPWRGTVRACLFGLSSRYIYAQAGFLLGFLSQLDRLMPASTTSSAPLAGFALDALLDRITVLKLQQKSIEAELSPLLEQLSDALEAGELDAVFSHNGCSFSWSAGRTSYAYPEPLLQQEQALKDAQRLAVATGAASKKQGKAFWTIKAARA